MKFTVYLAGEIHSDWREQLKEQTKDLALEFVGPQSDHDLSDGIGENILGEQPGDWYRDQAASNINNFRTQTMMNRADFVIAKFGEEYKQWNTAMDASAAIERGKPLIIIRPESAIHALKELENKANVAVESIEQAVQVIEYLFV